MNHCHDNHYQDKKIVGSVWRVTWYKSQWTDKFPKYLKFHRDRVTIDPENSLILQVLDFRHMMKFLLPIVAVVFALFVHNASGYNILGIFHTGGKSHYILAAALMKGLAEAGHNVSLKFQVYVYKDNSKFFLHCPTCR